MKNTEQSIYSSKYKKLSKYLISLLAVGLLSACDNKDSSSSDSGEILIKFPHVTSPATPKGKSAEYFKELVHDRLAGKVKVEVYPSGQLMNDDDSIEALVFGEVQMIATSLSKFDRLTKKFQVFDLPFMFPNIEAIERFQSGPARGILLDAMVSRGLQGLAFWHNGMKQFTGPVAMNVPEAADGLKFRIMESDVLQAQIEQIGGNPQKMAFGEVYQALQTGAVDAQENTWSNIYSSKFYEVQKYLTETNHGYVGYLVLVNAEFWAKLPEDIRTELSAIIAEVSEWGNKQSKQINSQGLEKIKASGSSEIVQLTDDERLQWRNKMTPVWQEFTDEIGAEIIESAKLASQ